MYRGSAVAVIARFILRFAALLALTLAVLASVSVGASRNQKPVQSEDHARPVPDTADAVNDRRYPLRYPVES